MRERGGRRRAGRRGGRRRRAPLSAGPSSQETAARGLRRAAFQTETTRRERRARGTCPGLGHGRRNALAAAPWTTAESSSGERGRGARRPRFAWQKDGKRAGGESKLTKATKRGKKGSNWRDDAGRRLKLRLQFLAGLRTKTEAKWGGEGGARLCPLIIRARGGREDCGRGGGAARRYEQRERGNQGRAVGGRGRT